VAKIAAMIDIETLDTKASSVVLSVGACKFDPYSLEEPYDKKYYRLDIDSQLALGRTTSDSTIEWWGKQPPEIQAEAFGEENRVQLADFFADLNKWLVGVDKIWCQGPQFDMVILEHLYELAGHHRNWAYWQICDCRTVFNMMPSDPRKSIQQNLHNAQWDAYYQAICVQKSFKHFNVGGEW